MKGSNIFTGYQVLGLMPKEETYFFWGPNGHLFSQKKKIFIEDIKNCTTVSEWVNESKSLSPFSSSTSALLSFILKPIQVTPSMA